MTLGTMLDTLLLGPLKLLFETVFSLAYRLGSAGTSIVILSLVMNFLVLPLYRRADVIQEEAIAAEQKMRPVLNHIRSAFHGDERFMIQQTFYRQNHYSPLSALKGALPLLLEIPFFIAAYRFLSGLELLHGMPFGPIRDLGAPDGLLAAGGRTVNLLPVLMTVINAVSGTVYTRGAPLKSRIQLYGMAALFLVLLYNSPAGLTMYWTLNNLFSLVKNVITRNAWLKKHIRQLTAAAGAAVLAASLTAGPSVKWKAAGAILALGMQIPLLASVLKRKGAVRSRRRPEKDPSPGCFFLSGVLTAVLTGLLIPSSILADSPSEFVNAMLVNPTWYVIHAFLYALGFFVIWSGVFYLLGSRRTKKGMELAMWTAGGLMVVQYMTMRPDRGNLSAMLRYDVIPVLNTEQILINLAVLCAAGLILCILLIRSEILVRILCLAGTLALGGMGVRNLLISQPTIRETAALYGKQMENPVSVPLSRTGKNVVVIMLDRAIGSYPSVIFGEKPELKEKFDGFTWYPNTLSHGAHTLFGSPGLFGGYEYTPRKMNQQPDRLLKDKHNEALLVLPTMFSREGHTVSVCSPPFAGQYKWQADLSLYDGIPDCRVCDAEMWGSREFSAEKERDVWLRNFFCYGLSEASPLAAYGTLYNMGLYNQVMGGQMQTQVVITDSTAEGIDWDFLNDYTILKRLGDYTEIRDDGRGTLNLFETMITHYMMMLQEPDYVPAYFVDNTEYDRDHWERFSAGVLPITGDNYLQRSNYQINMSAFMLLGDWFDYLKENGVYDNTRIIVVSDHGWILGQMPDMILPKGEDVMHYAALLMVKDFNQHGEPETDFTFMTNADTPWLAVHGVLESGSNPFTGRPLEGSAYKAEAQYVSMNHESNPEHNTGTTFMPSDWYTVKDYVYDLNNWTYAGFQ